MTQNDITAKIKRFEESSHYKCLSWEGKKWWESATTSAKLKHIELEEEQHDIIF